MRSRRSFAAATVALAAMVVLGSAAAAQAGNTPGYVDLDVSGSISDATVVRGQVVTVTGSGFSSDITAEFGVLSTYQRLVASTPVGVGGLTSASITIPFNLEFGPHTARVTGLQSGAIARVPFTVISAVQAGGDGGDGVVDDVGGGGDVANPGAQDDDSGFLPFTGSGGLDLYLLLGLILIVTGGVTIVVARWRRESMPTGLT